MTNPEEKSSTEEPAGGGSEDNGNVHVENKPEWKKRPEQYPDPAEQTQIDTDRA